MTEYDVTPNRLGSDFASGETKTKKNSYINIHRKVNLGCLSDISDENVRYTFG